MHFLSISLLLILNLTFIGQELCWQTYPSDCDYFIYDKKNCQCKLLKVNNADLLHEYNHDCRKLGGFKNPGLEFCPAFENGENSCTVSIFHCNTDV